MLYGVRICHGSGGYGETRYHVKHSQSMVHALMILKGVYSMHDACDDPDHSRLLLLSLPNGSFGCGVPKVS